MPVLAGRLTSLAHVSVPAMATAVNAALSEVCNPVRLSPSLRMQSRNSDRPGLSRTCVHTQAGCLVVADRPTAEQVLQVYEARRAGIVTCKIVSEHAPRYALATHTICCRRCLHAHDRPGLMPRALLALTRLTTRLRSRCSSASPPLPDGLEPLLAYINLDPDAADAQCVFDAMLGRWAVAQDRASAACCIACALTHIHDCHHCRQY